MKTPEQQIADALNQAIEDFDDGKVGFKLTQAELSRRSGVSQPTISRTLLGKTIPETVTLCKLIGVLGKDNLKLADAIASMLPDVGKTSFRVLTAQIFSVYCPQCNKVSHKSFMELEANSAHPCPNCGSSIDTSVQYGQSQLEMILQAFGNSGFTLGKKR